MSMYNGRSESRHSPMGCIWPLLFLAAAIAFLFWWFWRPLGNGLNPQAQPRPVVARGDLTEVEKTNIAIYEAAYPAVVHVTNVAEERRPFSFDILRIPKGTGSGFVWDTDGHIVTNYHVVKGAA